MAANVPRAANLPQAGFLLMPNSRSRSPSSYTPAASPAMPFPRQT